MPGIDGGQQRRSPPRCCAAASPCAQLNRRSLRSAIGSRVASRRRATRRRPRRSPGGAEPGGGAFPSDAKTPRRQSSGIGGLRNSPSFTYGLRTVLGLLPSPSIRLGASRWGPLRRRRAPRRHLRGARAGRGFTIWHSRERHASRIARASAIADFARLRASGAAGSGTSARQNPSIAMTRSHPRSQVRSNSSRSIDRPSAASSSDK
jgi:hypothetical protein